MHACRALALLLVQICLCPVAWGWGEQTHQRMTADALGSILWLNQYQDLKPTPFSQMVTDVFGQAEPASPSAFDFFGKKTRQAKQEQYLASTAPMADKDLQRFSRHLLLSNKTSIPYGLEEAKRSVSARQVLAHYSAEPDAGMDMGLDASWTQGLMGGRDPQQTSSQGFRHMNFLLGSMGQAPQRAQLCFDIGRKAIEQGHPYWGFRFTAWGLHYLEDLGTPVHTHILPTTKFLRVKGMVRPKDPTTGERHFNKGVLKDLVAGATQITSNYHSLYEAYVDQAYTGSGAEAQSLRSALQDSGKPAGFFKRMLAPRTIGSVARRRGWSRLSSPGIARNAVRFFTETFRQPAAGAPENTVVPLTAASVQQAVVSMDRPLAGEGIRGYERRMTARQNMMTSTAHQFQKNGTALRRAVTLLGQQLGTR